MVTDINAFIVSLYYGSTYALRFHIILHFSFVVADNDEQTALDSRISKHKTWSWQIYWRVQDPDEEKERGGWGKTNLFYKGRFILSKLYWIKLSFMWLCGAVCLNQEVFQPPTSGCEFPLGLCPYIIMQACNASVKYGWEGCNIPTKKVNL